MTGREEKGLLSCGADLKPYHVRHGTPHECLTIGFGISKFMLLNQFGSSFRGLVANQALIYPIDTVKANLISKLVSAQEPQGQYALNRSAEDVSKWRKYTRQMREKRNYKVSELSRALPAHSRDLAHDGHEDMNDYLHDLITFVNNVSNLDMENDDTFDTLHCLTTYFAAPFYNEHNLLDIARQRQNNPARRARPLGHAVARHGRADYARPHVNARATSRTRRPVQVGTRRVTRSRSRQRP